MPSHRKQRSSGVSALAVVLLLVAATPLLAGCGYDYPTDGDLYVWNRTDSTTNETVLEFKFGPDGGGLGNNVLITPIIPADQDYVWTVFEGIWDGEALMELGGFVDFFDFFCGYGNPTTLQVF